VGRSDDSRVEGAPTAEALDIVPNNLAGKHGHTKQGVPCPDVIVPVGAVAPLDRAHEEPALD